MKHLKPVCILEGERTPDDLRELKAAKPIWRTRDVYRAQLKELFQISNPALVHEPVVYARKEAEFLEERTADQRKKIKGAWVYYPWSGFLVHMLGERDYFAVRTNRNRNLITAEEQEKLRESRVGIIGLSVGSSVATTLAYSGIGKYLKLAEFDVLETSNLNRIRARVDQIGARKIDLTLQAVYEVDPFASITTFDQGIDESAVDEFIDSEPKPQVIFEIIDGFMMKIYLRARARERGIPVIMVTNLGDRILMDVERYDLDRELEFFNGRAGHIPQKILNAPDITDVDKHKYAVELAGREHIPPRAMESVAEIGKTLIGRPQLASTVTIASGFGAYFAKKIILGDSLPSGSWLVDLDGLFQSNTSI